MKTNTTMPEQSHSFFDAVARAEERILLMDYEGILAPVCPDEDGGGPLPDAWALAQEITHHHTRLITISGWPAYEVASRLGTQWMPEIWGNDGLERLYPNGRYECADLHSSLELLRALAECEYKLQEAGLANRMKVKLSGIHFHWRGLNPSEKLDVRTHAYRVLQPLIRRYPALRITTIEEGFELCLPAANKAEAIRSFIEKTSRDIPIAYLGQSIRDEKAFRILNGRGLTVLVRTAPRFTAAQVCLRPPEELLSFFRDWISASRAGL
jgi:trehalose 6-phosphate phosphatase